MLCIPSLWHFSSSPLLQQTVIPGIRSCATRLQTWKTNFNMLTQVRCLPSSCLAGVHSSKFLVTLQHLKPSTVPAHLTIFIVLKPFQAAMWAFFLGFYVQLKAMNRSHTTSSWTVFNNSSQAQCLENLLLKPPSSLPSCQHFMPSAVPRIPTFVSRNAYKVYPFSLTPSSDRVICIFHLWPFS